MPKNTDSRVGKMQKKIITNKSRKSAQKPQARKESRKPSDDSFDLMFERREIENVPTPQGRIPLTSIASTRKKSTPHSKSFDQQSLHTVDLGSKAFGSDFMFSAAKSAQPTDPVSLMAYMRQRLNQHNSHFYDREHDSLLSMNSPSVKFGVDYLPSYLQSSQIHATSPIRPASSPLYEPEQETQKLLESPKTPKYPPKSNARDIAQTQRMDECLVTGPTRRFSPVVIQRDETAPPTPPMPRSPKIPRKRRNTDQEPSQRRQKSRPSMPADLKKNPGRYGQLDIDTLPVLDDFEIAHNAVILPMERRSSSTPPRIRSRTTTPHMASPTHLSKPNMPQTIPEDPIDDSDSPAKLVLKPGRSLLKPVATTPPPVQRTKMEVINLSSDSDEEPFQRSKPSIKLPSRVPSKVPSPVRQPMEMIETSPIHPIRQEDLATATPSPSTSHHSAPIAQSVHGCAETPPGLPSTQSYPMTPTKKPIYDQDSQDLFMSLGLPTEDTQEPHSVHKLLKSVENFHDDDLDKVFLTQSSQESQKRALHPEHDSQPSQVELRADVMLTDAMPVSPIAFQSMPLDVANYRDSIASFPSILRSRLTEVKHTSDSIVEFPSEYACTQPLPQDDIQESSPPAEDVPEDEVVTQSAPLLQHAESMPLIESLPLVESIVGVAVVESMALVESIPLQRSKELPVDKTADDSTSSECPDLLGSLVGRLPGTMHNDTEPIFNTLPYMQECKDVSEQPQVSEHVEIELAETQFPCPTLDVQGFKTQPAEFVEDVEEELPIVGEDSEFKSEGDIDLPHEYQTQMPLNVEPIQDVKPELPSLKDCIADFAAEVGIDLDSVNALGGFGGFSTGFGKAKVDMPMLGGRPKVDSEPLGDSFASPIRPSDEPSPPAIVEPIVQAPHQIVPPPQPIVQEAAKMPEFQKPSLPGKFEKPKGRLSMIPNKPYSNPVKDAKKVLGKRASLLPSVGPRVELVKPHVTSTKRTKTGPSMPVRATSKLASPLEEMIQAVDPNQFHVSKLLAFSDCGDFVFGDKGLDQAKEGLLASETRVEASIATDPWIANQYRMIVWLMHWCQAHDSKNPLLERAIVDSFDVLLAELRYRYDFEVNLVQHSPFKTMTEEGIKGSLAMVWLVDDSTAIDGWYSLGYHLDNWKNLRKSLIGSRFWILGARVSGLSGEGKHVLDVVDVVLQLSRNTARAVTECVGMDCVGLHSRDELVLTVWDGRLQSYFVDGGKIPVVVATLARAYPLYYVEHFETGPPKRFTEEENAKEQCKQEERLVKEKERLLVEVDKDPDQFGGDVDIMDRPVEEMSWSAPPDDEDGDYLMQLFMATKDRHSLLMTLSEKSRHILERAIENDRDRNRGALEKGVQDYADEAVQPRKVRSECKIKLTDEWQSQVVVKVIGPSVDLVQEFRENEGHRVTLFDLNADKPGRALEWMWGSDSSCVFKPGKKMDRVWGNANTFRQASQGDELDVVGAVAAVKRFPLNGSDVQFKVCLVTVQDSEVAMVIVNVKSRWGHEKLVNTTEPGMLLLFENVTYDGLHQGAYMVSTHDDHSRYSSTADTRSRVRFEEAGSLVNDERKQEWSEMMKFGTELLDALVDGRAENLVYATQAMGSTPPHMHLLLNEVEPTKESLKMESSSKLFEGQPDFSPLLL
jgi:hypothetical protein